MPEEALLIGLSQIGATFAGFVAIFLIFVRRDGRFSPADALRIRALIYTSLLVILTSLIPVMMTFVVGEDVLWQRSAQLALAIGVMSIVDVARAHAAMTKADVADIVLLHAVITYGLAFAAAALVAILAFGLAAGSALYLIAVMLTLVSVVVTFITLAFKNLF